MICNKSGHGNKEIIQICFYPFCNMSQCCEQCINIEHKDHKQFFIPIKYLMTDLLNRNLSDIFYGQQVQKELQRIRNSFIKLIQIIDNEIDRLNQNQFKELALSNYILNETLNNNKNISVEQQIYKISEVLKVSDQQILQLRSEPHPIVYSKTIKYLYKMPTLLLPVIDNIQNKSYIRKIKPEFSEEMKHKDIKIIDGNIAKKIDQQSFSIAFGEDSFKPQTDSFKFAIKIVNRATNIWIGVGGNVNTNYLFGNYSKIGHYKYMIGFNKFVFHHSEQKINQTMSGFTFDTGAIINISYECCNSTLTFTKLNTNEYFCMKMGQQDYSQILYPIVWLQGPDDTVQILEYQI